jgi:hypothetical protein
MVEDGRKPNPSERALRRKKPLSPIGQSIISGLNKDGENARVVANFRYTSEELTQLGGGDFKVGARRVMLEVLKHAAASLREEIQDDSPRPLQEELDTQEPTPFGTLPKTNTPN